MPRTGFPQRFWACSASFLVRASRILARSSTSESSGMMGGRSSTRMVVSGSLERSAKAARPEFWELLRCLCWTFLDHSPTRGLETTYSLPYSIRRELEPFQWAVL